MFPHFRTGGTAAAVERASTAPVEIVKAWYNFNSIGVCLNSVELLPSGSAPMLHDIDTLLHGKDSIYMDNREKGPSSPFLGLET